MKALGRSADVAAYLMAPNCLCIDPAATAASRSTSPIQTESHVSSGHQQRTSERAAPATMALESGWRIAPQQQHLTYLSMSWECMRDVLCLLRPRHSWPHCPVYTFQLLLQVSSYRIDFGFVCLHPSAWIIERCGQFGALPISTKYLFLSLCAVYFCSTGFSSSSWRREIRWNLI